MKQPINVLIITQLVFVVLYFIHTNSYQGIGSDFMFFILMSSFVVSGLLFWQIFKVGNSTRIQKILGLICASFPFLFVLGFLSLFLFSR
jgi:hypothetical protein